MNRVPPYAPPNPWDGGRDAHHHRGRGRRVVERGRPIDIEFAGFRSDTWTLQHHGWEISESVVPNRDAYGEENWRIAIRHPELKMSGMSVANRIHTRRQIRDDYHNGRPGAPIHLHVEIGMPMMIREYNGNMGPNTFRPVDARPYLVEVRAPYDLYHMPYFQPLRPDSSKEIFLREASVAEIMAIALDKQQPQQSEIRARRRAENDRAELRRGGVEKARLIMVA